MLTDIDNTPLGFGKYKGSTPNEIGEHDPKYVLWMYEQVRPRPCSKELAVAVEQDIRETEAMYYDAFESTGNVDF